MGCLIVIAFLILLCICPPVAICVLILAGLGMIGMAIFAIGAGIIKAFINAQHK